MKQFRRELYQSEYAPLIDKIKIEMNDILNDAKITTDITKNDETVSAIERLKQKSVDVNDSYYCELCLKNNYILVTHDKDFRNTGLNILTTNKKLL